MNYFAPTTKAFDDVANIMNELKSKNDKLITLYNDYVEKYDDFPIVIYNLSEDQQKALIDPLVVRGDRKLSVINGR